MPEINSDLHVTICYSREKVDFGKLFAERNKTPSVIKMLGSKRRSLDAFGKENDHIVLKLSPKENDRLSYDHEAYKTAGAVSDFPEYNAHITLFKIEEGVEFNTARLKSIKPYSGLIHLDRETMEPLKD